MKTGYLIPLEVGAVSEDKAVGKRVAQLLDALDSVNGFIARGELVEECSNFRDKILTTLKGLGWRITVKQSSDKWQVLPPLVVRKARRA